MSDNIQRELGEISSTLKNMERQLAELSSVRDDVIQAKAVGRAAIWLASFLAPVSGFIGAIIHGLLKNGN